MKPLSDTLGTIIIPLLTPFTEQGDLNYGEAEKLVDHLITKKYCDSILVAGTTGEFHALNDEERIELYGVVKGAAAGRVPLLAGTGASSTAQALRLTQEAEKLGYAAAMVVSPYYCKPSQEGIYRHFETIAKNTKLPVVLYNIPLDGDDIMILCGMVQGAAGVISGGSHLLGDRIRRMIDLFLGGEVEQARAIHMALDPFFKALCPGGRVNPIPVLKAALELAGHPVGPPRLPLDPATAEEREAIKKHLVRLKVL